MGYLIQGYDMSKNFPEAKLFAHYIRDPSAVVGSILLLIVMVGAIFGPLFASQNPYDLASLSLEDSMKPPIWMEDGSKPFLLGTDAQGRDILSTILYGCRTSLLVGFGAVTLSSVIGITLGLLAGFYRRGLDTVLMRLADILFSFSQTLMAILILGILKQKGVFVVILAISVAGWVQYARTIRGGVLSVKEQDYVSAAKAAGVSDFRMILRHILPNVIPPILVIAAVDFGVAVMLEATLSFLGIGVPVTEPSLGMMISRGRQYIYAGKWWLIVFPGGALMTIVLGLNLVADWLREEINPKLKRR